MFFLKNSTPLLEIDLKEKDLGSSEFHVFQRSDNTVWKIEKFTLTKKIFRQIKYFVTYLST